MSRGGKRTGAGRPRKSVPARKLFEKCFQDGSAVRLGWDGDRVITLAADGELAHYLRQKLFERLQEELLPQEILSVLEDLSKSSVVSMTLNIACS